MLERLVAAAEELVAELDPVSPKWEIYLSVTTHQSRGGSA
jgi:hypothetical protein